MRCIPRRRVHFGEGRRQTQAQSRDVFGRENLRERLYEVLNQIRDGGGKRQVDIERAEAGV